VILCEINLKINFSTPLGFYFLVEFSTDDKKANEASRDDYQKRTCYAGLRFEQLMTGKVAEEEAKKKKADELHRPLDPNAEHNGVFTGGCWMGRPTEFLKISGNNHNFFTD